VDDEFLPDFNMKEFKDYKRNPSTIDLPWLINGAPLMPIYTRFVGENTFSRMKVHKNEVLEHLFKIFRATLLSACDGDFQFLS